MLEKVTCEHCGNTTANAAVCMFCGKPLRKEKEPDMSLSRKNREAHATRALSFSRQRNIEVANVKFFQCLGDGTMPGLKLLRVPENHQAVLISDVRTESLGPGEHLVSNTGTAASLRDAMRSYRQPMAACACIFRSAFAQQTT